MSRVYRSLTEPIFENKKEAKNLVNCSANFNEQRSQELES